MPTIQEVQRELDSLRRNENKALLTKEVKRADAIVCAIVSVLGKASLCNSLLQDLNDQMTQPGDPVLSAPDPANYVSIDNTPLPQPPLENELSQGAILAARLMTLLLEQEQSSGVNLGRTVEQVPIFFDLVPTQVADNLVSNDSLWNDENGNPTVFTHGNISHRIQHYIFDRAKKSGLVDTSVLEKYFDFLKPVFLFKYLLSTQYTFNFGRGIIANREAKKTHWHMALESSALRAKGEGSLSVLYQGDKLMPHFAGPLHVVEQILSPDGFKNRPALAHAVHYLHYAALFEYANTMNTSVKHVFDLMVENTNGSRTMPSALSRAMNVYLIKRFPFHSHQITRNKEGIAINTEMPIKDPAKLSAFCQAKGMEAYKASKLRIALEFYLQAVDLAIKGNSLEDEAKSSHSLGSVYRDMGKLREAQTAYERAYVLKQDIFGRHHESTKKTGDAIIKVIQMRAEKAAPAPVHSATPSPMG